MAEMLIVHDPKQVLEETKRILEQNGCLPTNCPKKTCLRLRNINLVNGEIKVRLDANPPQLPTTNPKLYKYELNPICENECGIGGNSNRGFEVKQNSTTGKIISAKGEWLSERL